MHLNLFPDMTLQIWPQGISVCNSKMKAVSWDLRDSRTYDSFYLQSAIASLWDLLSSFSPINTPLGLIITRKFTMKIMKM